MAQEKKKKNLKVTTVKKKTVPTVSKKEDIKKKTKKPKRKHHFILIAFCIKIVSALFRAGIIFCKGIYEKRLLHMCILGTYSGRSGIRLFCAALLYF